MSNQPRALITGSTRGIGLAIAAELARRGMLPILNYRNDSARAEKALASVRTLCEQTSLIQADVTQEEQVVAMFRDLLHDGPIDLLVNGVGAFGFQAFLDTSASEWRRLLESNLLSAVYCSQCVLPSMRDERHGHIINIGSMHAEQARARPHTLPYAIAKAGIIHLTRTLAKTEAPYGIRVNAICPGFIEGGDHTDPKDTQRVPLGRLGRAEDVANAIAFLVSEDAGYITGVALDVHGGALL
jgi:3-oxoacyl-[acyl-carrier protein] reductase